MRHVRLVTPTLPAAPVLVAEAAVAEEVFEPEAEAVAEVVETVFIVPEALEVEVAPMGAVDCPLISAWTVELNVPVMPVIVNLAENASAGNWEFVASFRLIDVKRTKYSSLLGPMVPSGVKATEEVVDTSTLELMICSNVCWLALPV